MSDRNDLLQALAPVLEHLSRVDVDDASAGDRRNVELPLGGELLEPVEALVREGIAAGWLCPKEAGGIGFGRVSKPGPDSCGFSVDAVDMDRPGPEHIHPKGEIDLAFALEGSPTFEDRPAGWTVLGAQSQHVPTVAGGRMAVLYFLPDGAFEFVR